jgi:DNA-binding MarR family transcriptional regulator
VHYSDRLLSQIKRAEQATQATKAALLRPLGLTPAQHNVLTVVHELPGITGAELSRRVFVTPQTITSTVNRLERDGLIVRTQHPVHRTLIEMTLTDRGREVFAAADVAVIAYDARLRAAVDEAELATLERLLGRVTEVAQNIEHGG